MERLKKIKEDLLDIQLDEATRLYRLARRAAAHGCSRELVVAIRLEGLQIARMNCEQLLNPFNVWKFAFGGDRK